MRILIFVLCFFLFFLCYASFSHHPEVTVEVKGYFFFFLAADSRLMRKNVLGSTKEQRFHFCTNLAWKENVTAINSGGNYCCSHISVWFSWTSEIAVFVTTTICQSYSLKRTRMLCFFFLLFFFVPLQHKSSTAECTVGEFAFRLPWISFMGICPCVERKKNKLGHVKENWQKVANATLNQISLESLNAD